MEFLADKPGTFWIRCNVQCHPVMHWYHRGRLVVGKNVFYGLYVDAVHRAFQDLLYTLYHGVYGVCLKILYGRLYRV